MITQQELTDQCTSEIIKKMVELAEGFEYNHNGDISYYNNLTSVEIVNCTSWFIFPLLIHRAVEGCSHIIVDYESKHVEETTMCKLYNFKDYQPTTLTHAECAMLDCLLEIEMSKYRVEYDNAMRAETYPEVISKRIAQNRVNELEHQKAELLKFIRKVYKEQWINNREFMDILKKYEVKE